MPAVAVEREPCCGDRLHRPDSISFDARNLHQPSDGIAGQAQIVLHSDLGGVLDLLRRTTENLSQRTGRHRASGADLALAADFCAGDRRSLLIDRAQGARNEQEVDDGVIVGATGTKVTA